uniref:Tudor domain-containing protein n=1 Tax=Caenorhabditis tropicalis TaxID=1561998 RepID=A0A1I7TSU1_9PELO
MSHFQTFKPFIERDNTGRDGTYNWADKLRKSEKKDSQIIFAPWNAFWTDVELTESFLKENFKIGVIVEAVLPVHEVDIHNSYPDRETRWFAEIKQIAGCRMLIKFLMSESYMWINLLSRNLDGAHIVRLCCTLPPMSAYSESDVKGKDFLEKNSAAVTNCLTDKQLFDTSYGLKRINYYNDPFFLVGQRLEVLNYADTSEIFVAFITEKCGRRIRILITGMGQKELLKRDKHHCQADPEQEFWVDQESNFIFPVGFAIFNHLKLVAEPEYITHAKRVVRLLRKHKACLYNTYDVNFSTFHLNSKRNDLRARVQVGDKFELLDPFDKTFKKLKCASVIKIMRSDGYMIVREDGDLTGPGFPLNTYTTTFMFPVGYAAEHNLPLENRGFIFHGGEFDWDQYLKEEDGTVLKMDREYPEREELQKEALLEVIDLTQNDKVWPACVSSVHGRIVKIHFLGKDSTEDKLYNVESPELQPVGWCEAHSYPLQDPGDAR